MSHRRKKGRPVSGWIILDKRYDLGSTEAVSKLKWLLQAQKAGHAGTLDPLATGVLPVAFGEATKTVPYIMSAPKRYRFTARWGCATATDDAEGAITFRSERRPTPPEIASILPKFSGDIEQFPPQFSAIKIGGQRAYDLAREGVSVDMKARRVHIYSLSMIDCPDPDHAVFEACTGKGAYVRALVRDMARALGTEGHVTMLRRLSVGPFDAAQSISIETLEAYGSPEARDAALLPVSCGLAALPQASIGGPEASRLKLGQPAVISPATAKSVRGQQPGLIPEVAVTLHGEAVAICALDGLKLVPIRVFNG